MTRGDRLTALDAGSRGVLLLFLRGGTGEDLHLSGGTIPGHDGSGQLHMAFAVPEGSLDDWRRRLAACGVTNYREMAWQHGGTRPYFLDPEGHVLELAEIGREAGGEGGRPNERDEG